MAKIFGQIIFISLLFSQDYYISFYYLTKNHYTVASELEYSKALTESKEEVHSRYKIATDFNQSRFFFKYHKEEIIDTLSQDRVYYYQNSAVKQFLMDECVKITYPPKRISVTFENGYAILGIKE